MVERVRSDIRLATYEPEWIRPDRIRLAAQQHAAEAIQQLQTPMLGVAELAPEQARNTLHGYLDRAAHGETSATSNRPRESRSLAALESVLRVRIDALQQAVSNLKQAEQDG
jgi:hypothetical protein